MFDKNVLIENIALGREEGEAVLYESDSHALSSMSAEYIKAVGRERFSANEWKRTAKVKVKTLDGLIENYGRPKFIKIDVEGYEMNVLSGLSTAVPYLSFEFTPELPDETARCVERLNEISDAYRYNYCLGEDLNFAMEHHVERATFITEVIPELSAQGNFGDVYAVHENSK